MQAGQDSIDGTVSGGGGGLDEEEEKDEELNKTYLICECSRQASEPGLSIV